jgi:alkaline phosphatase
MTLFGQLVPVARNYMALCAGTVGVAFLPFLVATIFGALLWNASFLTLGYFLGRSG